MHSTSVRIDVATHNELKRLAVELITTRGKTVAHAAKAPPHARTVANLATPLLHLELPSLAAHLR